MKYPQPFLAVAMSVAALLFAAPGHARQLGNGGTTFSDLWSSARPEDFLARFIELTQADMAADTNLLGALGVAQSNKPLPALDMNATTGNITDAAAAIAASKAQTLQALAAPAAASAANQADFAAAALALTRAARDFTDLTSNIVATKKSLIGAGARGRIALHAARNATEMAAQLRTEVKAVVAFADARQIALPAEVIAAAAAM